MSDAPATPAPVRVVDLGRLDYDAALAEQARHAEAVLAARDDAPEVGRLLLLEHDPPVITVSRRPGARDHLVASPDALARAGVQVRETDRGGDITYHGPGQLVAYPIVDLNTLGLNLHAYIRLLEGVAIDACAAFGLGAFRDPGATGVWVGGDGSPGSGAKVCAIGIRVRRWITSHGLALNVSTDLTHFDLIVPCGLAGRPVTSLSRELGDGAPGVDAAKAALVGAFESRVEHALAARSLRG